MQKWDLRGRPATAAIQLQQREKIVRSQAWNAVVAKPLLWVVEQAIDLEVVGGFSGPLQRPHLFVCLVFRALQILPKPELVMEMLRQDTHKYLRVFALCIVRLIGNVEMIKEARNIVEEDYRKIRVHRDVNSLSSAAEESASKVIVPRAVIITHVDEIGDELISRSAEQVCWLGVRFIPMMW